MLNGTVDQIQPASFDSLEPVTVGAVLDELQSWRDQKPNRNTAIPDHLWSKIFSLSSTLSHDKIKKILGIANTQYDKKYQELYGTTATANVPPNTASVAPIISASAPTAAAHHTPSSNHIQFRELKSTEPLFKPNDTLQKHTIVVEFHRSDGQLMRIHAVHSDFKTLIELFFEAKHHATYNPST